MALQEAHRRNLKIPLGITVTTIDKYAEFRRAYRDNPAAFVMDCIQWKDNEKPTDYQLEIITDLEHYKRESARGPHGLGKTAIVGWAVNWFALTNDIDTDWKIPVTASSWRQLSKYAWPEVRKWARRLNWGKIGREAYNMRYEMTYSTLHLKTGEAFAMASEDPEMIEGAHASRMLYIFDESKEIPAGTWDSAEGAFSAGDCYWLAVSTPGEPQGRFYEIQSCRPGFEDWHVKHVTLAEAIKAGRINKPWVEARKRQWTEEAAVYKNRVLGEFASSEESGVIPLSWIEKSNKRWLEWKDKPNELPFICVGSDIARSGEDKTSLALRFGNVISEIRKFSHADTMETTGRIVGILIANGGKAVVDVVGIGAGVVDRLREQKYEVRPHNSGEHSDAHDKSGEMGFVNRRSEGWWHLRELLDPDNPDAIALPPDDLLTGDLVSPHWKLTSGGKISIESKDDIKKRIGRSTDDGDAVMMAFDDGTQPSITEWIATMKAKNDAKRA